MQWTELPAGTDAVFLPGKIHGCEWQAYILYVNESANNGNGSFEIEIIDAKRILSLYAAVCGDADEFFNLLPDYFQGEWKYCDNGSEEFDELVDMYPKADFIVERDGGLIEEMMFLVDWAVGAVKLM